MSNDSDFEVVVDFDRVEAADARWRTWLDEHPDIAGSLDLACDVVVDTGRGADGDIRRYRVRVAAVEGTYSAVLRPGEADEVSVGGLDAGSLDSWLSAQGNVANRFTYRFTLRSGSVLVQGEGLIDERGDTAYRLRR